jgi:hypothetical protein
MITVVERVRRVRKDSGSPAKPAINYIVRTDGKEAAGELDAMEWARAHAGDISPGIPGGAAGRARMRSKAGLCTAIREHRRAALVVNTRSRRGRRLYPAVAARLQAAGFNLLGSFRVDQPGQLGASLATAIDLQTDLLILGGGDGSISEAARRLAYCDMALGIPRACRRPAAVCLASSTRASRIQALSSRAFHSSESARGTNRTAIGLALEPRLRSGGRPPGAVRGGC